MSKRENLLVSGNEAVALAALDHGVALGAGYPGTPSTEILEHFSFHGGRAQWAPNEKVALEVGLGAAFGRARALVTMKHVGLNVAADPFFTAAYTGVSGALVVVSADDPGMASSQNEQDNRRYAVAAGVPMLEPSDSSEAYAFTAEALKISEKFKLPVLLRLTTRVCHSKGVIERRPLNLPAPRPGFVRDLAGRVMIPSNARAAHVRLRRKLEEIQATGEKSPLNFAVKGQAGLGIITSGVCYQHVREAAPGASVLKLGLTYPLPENLIRSFAKKVRRLVVVEEGDPYLREAVLALGLKLADRAESYRLGELNVDRVSCLISGKKEADRVPPKSKSPELCLGCPHRKVFEMLKKLNCIVSGDIGCYTLGVLPPFEAMDTCVCMGASIGVGLGLRHTLPEVEAKRVVSVIGDSTFVHSGMTGLVEMVYNPPSTGHVVLVLDNNTTAMTGLQDHPGTGRRLSGDPAFQLKFEDLSKACGVQRVEVVESLADMASVEGLIQSCLDGGQTCLVVIRRPCVLSSKKRHAT